MNRWVNKEAFAALTDVKSVDEQISLREAQIRQMVGWLYPSILRDEIHELGMLKTKLKLEEATRRGHVHHI